MKVLSFSKLLLITFVVLVVKAKFIEDFIAFTQNVGTLIVKDNVAPNIDFGSKYTSKLDLYYNKNDTRTLKPIVIFIHGGGWVSGDKYNYIGLGSFLSKNEYVTVIPNYVLFPLGKVDDMVEDIYQMIQWTYQNASKYGGDKNRIILIGYSSGAHLAALTTIKVALKIKNNNKILSPLPILEKLILYNGPYDFDEYDTITNAIFKTEGVVDHGVLERIINILVSSRDTSPTDILKRYPDNSVKDFGFPKVILYYCEGDDMIPASSSTHLIEQMERVSPTTIINYIYNDEDGFDHGTLLMGTRDGKEDLQQIFLEILQM